MAQLAPISIMDGKDVPVAHVYNPVGIPAGAEFHLFVNRGTEGKPELQEELRAKLSVNGGQSPYRVKLSLLLPTAKTVEGVTELDFQNRVDVEFILNKRSTTASRKDILALVQNALQDTLVASMIEDLEQMY